MAAEVGYNEDAKFAKPCAVGAVTGFVLTAIGLTVVGRWAGFDDAGALGMAVFAAAWAGVGFGAMFGAIYAVARPALAAVIDADRQVDVPAAAAEAA